MIREKIDCIGVFIDVQDRTKQIGHMFSITLTSHKTSIYEIDVTYYLCDIGECGYKAKMASSVKTRKALIHEIDVVYYPCNKCNYEAKERNSLKKHIKRVFMVV